MDRNRILALFLSFKSYGIEVAEINETEMKIFLIVPKGINVEKVKRLVKFSFGEHMKVFVKEK